MKIRFWNKKKFKKAYIVFIREYRETKDLLYAIVKFDIKNLKAAKHQVIDLIKIFFLIILLILPGSVVIITFLEILSKKFGYTLYPQKNRFKKER